MNPVTEILPNESFLVSKLREGDENAFRQIYDFYWEKQYNLAFYKLGTRELAEELTQEVFTALWLQKETLDPGRPLRPYLSGAMKNQILNAWRKNHSREKYLQQVTTEESSEHLNEQLAYNELNDLIHQEISRLPEKCREVFTLSRVKGYTVQQIADELKISPKTVNNHLVKALKSMRIGLKDYITILVLFYLRS
ncbi:MAG TPA: RNA polymerase sigma-70 factor [Chitinophaga sp.]|uniref:RNA polymerase sigma factor n=1 Tax=Chitinophaga sp. TaxID=1869181 RepID=UPI002CB341BB|nr:RNA polymerase sigma-70 factor [Chitinophaga sp.]HVI44045.1 RNA polymerase sigma-70 factor [Chitinophaga sp.]